MAETRQITDIANAPAALRALVGTSDWAEQIRSVIVGVGPYPSSVVITGPSGTGKELIARAIHALSPRAEGRFIPVDCASITGTLFASHMFGHLKGAFTGATYNSLGCFRAAEGGTIFLDEIGELELELQAKLLRVLQERVVVPVGSHDGVPVNVRVIAATNRDLQREVAEGRFREDLYYRLNVVSVQTVPLRQRPEDIEILAEHFLQKLSAEEGMPLKRLSPAALRQLRSHSWPGNVRELENAMERAVLFSPSEIIGPEVLPADAPAFHAAEEPDTEPGREQDEVITIHQRAGLSVSASTLPALAIASQTEDGRWLTATEVEREHISRTLEHTGYNQSATARLLGIDRHQLRRRMASYGLDTSPARQGRPPLLLSEQPPRAA